MKRLGWIQAISLAISLGMALGGAAHAQAPYAVKRQGDVVQLRDNRSDTTVSVLLPVNNAYEMVVKGKNVIRMTIRSVDEMRARPGLNGVSLLAPFANRIDGQFFYANGKKYNFDMELGNVRGAVPIHGYLSGTSAWKLVEAKSDARGAWVTSRLEFWKYPDYMKQFPFAHTLTLTYRLADGALEVRARIDNVGAEAMPVVIGWHPYFALDDSGRRDWTLSVPARTRWLLTDTKVPTGQTEPASIFFGGDPRSVPLSRFSDRLIDDVFSDMERDARGRATVSFRSPAGQSIAVSMGPNYKGLVLYSTVPPVPGQAPAAGRGGNTGGRGNAPPAPPPVSVGPPIPLGAPGPTPPERGFVAIEPYAGITNAMNLAHNGVYKELQSIAPGGRWEESFWISASGY
jgi:aldose 1-epimerase